MRICVLVLLVFSVWFLSGCGQFSADVNHSGPVPGVETGASTPKSAGAAGAKVEGSDKAQASAPTLDRAIPRELPEGLAESDISESGSLQPTIYFFPVFNEDKKSCETKDKRSLHGAQGVVLATVCVETLEACGLQGSCAVVQSGKARSFNILGRVGTQDRFFEIPAEGCRFGYGVEQSCLDPFYSLAADLIVYRPGDVIFVPAVQGTVLPNGTKHDGYFVIRDQGRGVTGRGRFDFFTGFFGWKDSRNPFSRLGLGDVNTKVPYYRIQGIKAESIRKARAFPGLPAKDSVVEQAATQR